MKKRFITLMLALAFIFCGLVTLTACNDDPFEGKIIYKLTNNTNHCTVTVENSGSHDGSTYINEGENLRINITAEEGYYSNNLSVTVNGEVRPFLEDERTSTVRQNYYAGANITIENPTNNIEISLSGNFALASGSVKFETTEGYTEVDAQGTYIRFEENSFGFPTEETALADFVKNYTTDAKNIEATQGFSYYVYRKSYDKAPNEVDKVNVDEYDGNYGSQYYIDETNGEYGYKYTYKHWYSLLEKIEIKGSREINKSVKYSADGPFYTFYGEGYTSSDDKINITLDVATKTLTITLNDCTNIPQEVLSGLKLKVNNNETIHNGYNFATEGEMDGTSKVYTITLEDCYKYYNDTDVKYYGYAYEIDLNTYEFSTWFTNTLPEGVPA